MTGTNEVAKVGRDRKGEPMIELVSVFEVNLRRKVRPIIFEGYTPMIELVGQLVPIWEDAHVVPYNRAIRAGDQKLDDFKRGTHSCNNCHTEAGEWVDINTLRDGLDNALFYCSQDCAEQVEREVHDRMR